MLNWILFRVALAGAKRRLVGIEVAAVPLPARDNLFMGFLAS